MALSRISNQLSAQNQADRNAAMASLDAFKSFLQGVMNITAAAQTIVGWYYDLKARFKW